MRTIRTTTGADLPLDNDLLAVLETLYREVTGSNFIVKLDERSLPTGYRVTSENPRTQRATRGKMLKYNFGAAIHPVVRLDMMDAVFEPDSTAIRLQWLPRLDMLMTELAKENSILRLSYLAEYEEKWLVDARLEAVKDIINERWSRINCCYKLMIETEVFWRKGGPVNREEFE